MRLLVAGGGAFGREHLGALRRIGGLTLALAEPGDAARAAAVRDFALSDSDADFGVLMARFRPDGAIVVSPVSTHADIAMAALAQNIPVLVEKPVVADAATMRRLCAAAAAGPAFLQPAHILRFSAPHAALHASVNGGALGDLLTFTSRRYRDAGHARRYATVDPVLMTMIHDIDLGLWFDPAAAQKVRAQRQVIAGGGTLTLARVRTSGGAIWDLRTGWLHPGPDLPPDRIEVVGSLGSAEWVAGQGVTLFGGKARSIADGPDDPLVTELRCFLARLAGQRPPVPVRPEDALAGLELAEAIMESVAGGG